MDPKDPKDPKIADPKDPNGEDAKDPNGEDPEDPPRPTIEEQRRWLGDPKTYANLLGYALFKTQDKDKAEHVRSDTMNDAAEKIDAGKGPRTKTEMRRMLFGYLKVCIKRLDPNPKEIPTDPDDIEISEDEQFLRINLRFRDEIAHDVVEKVIRENPEHVRAAGLGPEEKRKGPMDVAARKRKTRARMALVATASAAVTAVMGALAFVLLVHPPAFDASHLTAAQLAAVERQVGIQECNAKRWRECNYALKLADSMDDGEGATDPRVEAAQASAKHEIDLLDAAKLREDAVAACHEGRWSDCVMYFDKAKGLDEPGDALDSIKDARAQALLALTPAPRPDAGITFDVKQGPGDTTAETTVKGPALLVAILVALLAPACDPRSAAVSPAPSAAISASASSAPPTASAPEAAPPDDMEATLQSRLDMARHHLAAADAGADPASHIERPFLLVGSSAGAYFDESAQLLARALPRFAERFATLPTKPVTVFVFPTQEEYDAFTTFRFGRPEASPFGFYRPETREAFVNVGPGVLTVGHTKVHPGVYTLTHEIVHPMIETDFPSVPAWLNEGIASLYEAPVFAGEHSIHGTTNWRMQYLRPALAANPPNPGARIDALFGMSRDGFYGVNDEAGQALRYAVARYLCLWLDGREQLWPFYRAYRDGVADDPTGEKAFKGIVGRTPAEASADWRRWAAAL